MVLIYCLIFLLIILFSGVIIFLYSRKKKYKIGLIISFLLILFVTVCLLTNSIDEWTITKKDVATDLKNLGIQLKDNFEITENKVSGMPERYQETRLLISEKDREQILNTITKSANFKSYSSGEDLIKDTSSDQSVMGEQIVNYKMPEFYQRGKYCRIENIPTRLILTVENKSKILRYQLIEE